MYKTLTIVLHELVALKNLSIIKQYLNVALKDKEYHLVWIGEETTDELELCVDIREDSYIQTRITITECAKHFELEG